MPKPLLCTQLTSHSLGAFLITFGLPVVVYLSVFLCNDVTGCPVPSLLHPSTLTLEKLKTEAGWPKDGLVGLFDLKVTGWVLAYYGLSLALQLLLPGEEMQGHVLGTGGRHTYKFNAFNSTLITLAGLAVGTAVQGAYFPVWTYIWDHFLQIITANLLVATATSVYVYLASFSVPHPGRPNPEHRELAKGGHTGSIIYDFFIGRELNPRIPIPSGIPLIGGQVIDIKVFNELRPGLLGWIILDLTFAAQQYRQHGFLTDSMILTAAFNTLYALDGIYVESQVINQMDIITDGFGFMLAFGDLVWLPFIYSLQCRYLATYPLQLGWMGVALILAIQGLGYYIFRAANNEKNTFRRNPDDPRVAHLSYITTSQGSKLITSGWWGTARHVNYFGDWIMSFSYCMPTGIAGYIVNTYTNPVTGKTTREVVQGEARGWGMLFTYFYIVYFIVLLGHRQRRDDLRCHRKYGKDWDRYMQLVKSRIIPGIY